MSGWLVDVGVVRLESVRGVLVLLVEIALGPIPTTDEVERKAVATPHIVSMEITSMHNVSIGKGDNLLMNEKLLLLLVVVVVALVLMLARLHIKDEYGAMG